jgi:hypothetical protein
MMWAIGEDPGVVSEETGHSDVALTFSTYRQARRFSPDDFETVEHPQAKAA